MATSFDVGEKITLSYVMSCAVHFDQKKDLKPLLSSALFISKLNMDKKVYRRISENIYQTLEEHKEASRQLQKIQFKKQALFDKMLSSRSIY